MALKNVWFCFCIFWPSCERKSKPPFFSLGAEHTEMSPTTLLRKSRLEILGMQTNTERETGTSVAGDQGRASFSRPQKIHSVD